MIKSAIISILAISLFVSTSNRDVGDRYAFHFKLEDTLTYAIEIITPSECSNKVFGDFQDLEITALWVSPSGRKAEEIVYLKRSDTKNVSYSRRQISSIYRESLKVDEKGVWSLYLTLPQEDVDKYKIYGTGIKITENGSRQIEKI